MNKYSKRIKKARVSYKFYRRGENGASVILNRGIPGISPIHKILTDYGFHTDDRKSGVYFDFLFPEDENNLLCALESLAILVPVNIKLNPYPSRGRRPKIKYEVIIYCGGDVRVVTGKHKTLLKAFKIAIGKWNHEDRKINGISLLTRLDEVVHDK